MNTQEEERKFNELQFNLGPILRSVRKATGLTQAEIAGRLNVNQSTYSKIERGVVSTSAENWLIFAHLMGINYDAPLSGIIAHGPNTLKDSSNSQLFKFPERFLKDGVISATVVLVILDTLRSAGYGGKVNEFFEVSGIDQDFFRMCNHSVNLTFVSELIEKCKFSPDIIDQVFLKESNLQVFTRGRDLDLEVFKNVFTESFYQFKKVPNPSDSSLTIYSFDFLRADPTQNISAHKLLMKFSIAYIRALIKDKNTQEDQMTEFDEYGFVVKIRNSNHMRS